MQGNIDFFSTTCRFCTKCKGNVDFAQNAGENIDFALHARQYMDFAQSARKHKNFALHARQYIDFAQITHNMQGNV